MAAFCYVRHDESSSTAVILDIMAARLAPPDLKGSITRLSVPKGTLLIWTAAHTPIDLYTPPDKGCAMILGEALRHDSPEKFLASDLYSDWSDIPSASGYFCWLVLRPSGELLAGADPFGLFPLYTMQESEAFALATSTFVLRAHPAYNRQLDLVGMARHLIENGCVSTLTLEQGGSRLATGRVLQVHPNTGKRTFLDRSVDWLCQPENKITDPREAVDLSIHMSSAAYERHTKMEYRAMLISGGLDTRLLAALAMKYGQKPNGYTFGEPLDFEAMLAKRVCRHVGGKWFIKPDQLPPAQTIITHELNQLSLAGGFSTVTLDGIRSLGVSKVPRSITGLLLDVHYSPLNRNPSEFKEDSFAYSMDLWINRFGVPEDVLRKMVRPGEMHDAVEEAFKQIYDEWNALEGDVTDRQWQTIMRHRLRPHLGSYLWKSCFYSWPQMIATDVPYVKALRSVSGEILKGRFLQRQTVAELSPKLARIPLGSISARPESIRPSRWNSIHQRMLMARIHLSGKTATDSLRIVRLLGIDTPVWREIRREAEAGRSAMGEFFDPEALKEYLPVPPAPPPPERQTFAGQWGIRLLLGQMLWLKARASEE